MFSLKNLYFRMSAISCFQALETEYKGKNSLSNNKINFITLSIKEFYNASKVKAIYNHFI